MAATIRQSRSAIGSIIYWPGENTPRGGIVCLHGSEGGSAGWNDVNCALFAAAGFAAMAHRYTEGRPFSGPPDIDDVPLDRTETALACLRYELAGIGRGIGLFGVSRGAEHALLVAQLMAEDGSASLPDALAVHSPPDATWPAFIAADFRTGRPWAGDRQLPAWSWRGSHERTRPGLLLHTERFPNPVFITEGTDDRVWDSAMARRLAARMTDAGRAPEAHFFDGEGHIFHPEAHNREWALLEAFFGRHLALSSGQPAPG
jgi:pimeloyl-ACP methyl ester carboxylesterase